jgi:HKD family nuclease
MQSKINDSRLIVFEDTKHNLLVGKNNEKILNILKKEYE